jgi:hypothetical protein
MLLTRVRLFSSSHAVQRTKAELRAALQILLGIRQAAERVSVWRARDASLADNR